MTQADFKQWAARHCKIFCFDVAANSDTLVEWCRIFAGCGYTVDELNAATDALARRAEPLPWLRDHLSCLHAAVRSIRFERRARRSGPIPKYTVSEEEIAAVGAKAREYLSRVGYRSRRQRRRSASGPETLDR